MGGNETHTITLEVAKTYANQIKEQSEIIKTLKAELKKKDELISQALLLLKEGLDV